VSEAERQTEKEGQPDAGEGPSNPDESVPSEEDAERDLPGVPEEAEGEGSGGRSG